LLRMFGVSNLVITLLRINSASWNRPALVVIAEDHVKRKMKGSVRLLEFRFKLWIVITVGPELIDVVANIDRELAASLSADFLDRFGHGDLPGFSRPRIPHRDETDWFRSRKRVC